MTRWCNATRRGFALVLDGGCAALMLGRGGGESILATTATPLAAREWYRVTATYDADAGIARVTQTPMSGDPLRTSRGEAVLPVGHAAFESPEAPLLFAAWSEAPPGDPLRTGAHYNGKLEAPRLAAAALGEAEMASLPAEAVLGAWDFSQGIDGETVSDLSPNASTGAP